VAEPAGPAVARAVILGVGNRLRGDDAIGCILCDELCEGHDPDPQPRNRDRNSPPRHQDTRRTGQNPGTLEPQNPVVVLDCGDAPENFVEPVAKLAPQRILIVDCCDFGEDAGQFRLFSRQELQDLSYGMLSTHTLPLSLTVELLSLETGATIQLLGIQPEQIEFGKALSEPVRRALPAVVEFVRNWARAESPVG